MFASSPVRISSDNVAEPSDCSVWVGDKVSEEFQNIMGRGKGHRHRHKGGVMHLARWRGPCTPVCRRDSGREPVGAGAYDQRRRSTFWRRGPTKSTVSDGLGVVSSTGFESRIPDKVVNSLAARL